MPPWLEGRRANCWTMRAQAAYKALVSNAHCPQARQAKAAAQPPSHMAGVRLEMLYPYCDNKNWLAPSVTDLLG